MVNLAQRRESLRAWQNPDGGWGYFPGRQSWLEPTVWAALALASDPSASGSVERAWQLMRSFRNADGGFRPHGASGASGWATALVVTFAEATGRGGPELDGAVHWLAGARGADSSLLTRAIRWLRPQVVEREVKHAGWPWSPGTTAWVEPTAHALIALKKVARRKPDSTLARRIDSGERMLLDVRCEDGGWNYGSPRALGVELPSFPETTALALAGLQERAPEGAFELSRKQRAGRLSPFARAWLAIVHREADAALPEGDDVLLAALAAVDPRVLAPGVGT